MRRQRSGHVIMVSSIGGLASPKFQISSDSILLIR
jgi:hypothetical protein